MWRSRWFGVEKKISSSMEAKKDPGKEGSQGDIEGPHARAAHRYAITWLQPTWSACACPLFVTEREKEEGRSRGVKGRERSILSFVPTCTLHPLDGLPTIADLRSRRSVDNVIVPRYFIFLPLTRCTVAFHPADKSDRGDWAPQCYTLLPICTLWLTRCSPCRFVYIAHIKWLNFMSAPHQITYCISSSFPYKLTN